VGGFIYTPSLVEETHGSSGQYVSFSLIDVGSGFTQAAYAVFPFCFFDWSPSRFALKPFGWSPKIDQPQKWKA